MYLLSKSIPQVSSSSMPLLPAKSDAAPRSGAVAPSAVVVRPLVLSKTPKVDYMAPRAAAADIACYPGTNEDEKGADNFDTPLLDRLARARINPVNSDERVGCALATPSQNHDPVPSTSSVNRRAREYVLGFLISAAL